ncbi:MAG: ABC transporter substrate-binding protein [Promethearchaeota archaeon]
MPVSNGLKKVRIAFLSTIYHTAFILMCNNWIDDKLHIKSEWELYGTGPSIIEKFLQEELDVGYIGLPPTIIGIDKGASIKCIAGGHVEGTCLIVPNHFKSYNEVNQNINEVFNQFQDKIIGVPKRGSIHDVILRNWIKKVGIEDKVQIQNYEITDFILIDMQEKLIDAACGTPALAAFLRQHLNSKLAIPPPLLWPYNPSYGIIVSNSLIHKFPEVVEGFIKLHKDACNALRENPQKIAKLIKNELKLIKEEFILDTFKISPKYCAALPLEFVNSTMKFVAVLRNLGYIKRDLLESEIFNFSFIEKIHPEKHHYGDGINLK